MVKEIIGISVAIYLLLFIYIVLKRSELTVFLMALVFSMVYFYPMLFGYTTVMNRYYEYIDHPIADKVYYMYWSILVLLFICDWLYCHVKTPQIKLGINFKEFNVSNYMRALLIINGSIFLYYLVILNVNFLKNKIYISHMLGQLFLVFQVLVIIYFIASIINKSKIGLLFSSIFLFWMLLIGFRTPLVIAFIGFVVMIYVNGKKLYFIKYIIPSVVAGIFVFVSKPFYTEFSQSKNIFSAINNSFFSLDTYIKELQFSEPFVTQAILNLTVSNNFQMDLDYMSRWFSRIVTGTSMLTNSTDFHDQFVAQFLPGIDYGVAYNIWAEFYSLGGLPMFITFLLLYLVILFVIQNVLVQSKGIMKICFAVIAAYWTFYLHRNNFENMILFTQVILIPILVLYLSSHIITVKNGGKKD